MREEIRNVLVRLLGGLHRPGYGIRPLRLLSLTFLRVLTVVVGSVLPLNGCDVDQEHCAAAVGVHDHALILGFVALLLDILFM